MDEQNMSEKIGIIRDLGNLKVQLAELSGKMSMLYEVKANEHKEMHHILTKHQTDIYGNGHEGIKTLVDRLVEINKSRHQHYILIYTALIGLGVELALQWLKVH